MREPLLVIITIAVAIGVLCVILRRIKKTTHSKDIIIPHNGGVLTASIGVETMGGLFEPILKEGYGFPVKGSLDFSTSKDMQDSVDIHILQGYSPLAKRNVKLVSYRLIKLPLLPRGVPQIRVTIGVNEKGVLTADADELYRGKKPAIVELSRNELSEEEQIVFRRQTEATRIQDEKDASLIRAHNEAELALYMARKFLAGGYGVRPSQDDLVSISCLINTVEKAQSVGTIDELRSTSRSLRSSIEAKL